MRKAALLIFATVSLTAFRFGSVDLGHEAATRVEEKVAAAAAEPVPKGNRQLGVSVGTAQDNDFDGSFTRFKNAGMDTTSLTLFWDELETSRGTFNPAINFLAIANAYYPPKETAVVLVIPVIDTVRRRMPADLMALPYDDAAVIARFHQLIDYIFTQIPDLTLAGFSIGNEVDLVLAGAAWTQYRNFFNDAAAYARTKRAGVPVGVKGTYGGLTGAAASEMAALNAQADAVFATYYPLNGDFTVKEPSVVPGEVDALCALYPGRRIDILEAGYPSGGPTHSSEAQQADFVRQLFRAWDAHAAQVRTINIVSSNDPSPQQLSDWQTYYGISDPIFLSYLGTLGLRTYAGSGDNKTAFDAFAQEAHRRGW